MADKPMKVFGDVDANAIRQMQTCLADDAAVAGVMMPDGHLGYSMPIGGVIAYRGAVSPSGVGFDIACGNKAVMLDAEPADTRLYISEIMDEVFASISFGVGLKNEERVEHELFDDPMWGERPFSHLKELAHQQLGTVGGGNHYVDIFEDESGTVWVGCHFGSRGFGHKVASGFLNLANGADFGDRYHDDINAPATVLSLDTPLGQDYWHGMELAGRYAYTGRDWVCQKVADILGANILREIHNHHNFAWREEHDGLGDVVVVRKGATPAHAGQMGFVGSTMAERSVVLEGMGDPETLHSAVHGAGRVLSRSAAKGKPKKGKPGLVSREDMDGMVGGAGVCLRGADVDEAPQCYKRLDEVLEHIPHSITVDTWLKPLGVAMAGPFVRDPYKD